MVTRWVFDFDRFILISTLGVAALGVALTWWYGRRAEAIGLHGERLSDDELAAARFLYSNGPTQRKEVSGTVFLASEDGTIGFHWPGDGRVPKAMYGLGKNGFAIPASIWDGFHLSRDGRAIVRANRRRRLAGAPFPVVKLH